VNAATLADVIEQIAVRERRAGELVGGAYTLGGMILGLALVMVVMLTIRVDHDDETRQYG
jgi:hypothetical protein